MVNARETKDGRNEPGSDTGSVGGSGRGGAGATESSGRRSPEPSMSITEIRIKLTDDPRNKLKAYCSVTIDDALVIRDLKIIEGAKGPFVAMPSRKLADHCPKCSHKNHLRASYCNQCGARLEGDRAPRDDRGRARLHADLAHPINSPTRLALHRAVVSAYQAELEHAQRVGVAYRPRSFDDLDYLADGLDADYLDELERRCEARERDRRTEDSVGQARGSGRSESAVEAGE